MEIPGYIYVITTKLYEKINIFKVGCTKNIDKRLSQMNSTRFKDDIFFVRFIHSTRFYYTFENKVHILLKDYRKNNEFFNCSIDSIINAINTVKKDYVYDDYLIVESLNKKLKWYKEHNYFEYTRNNCIYTVNTTEMLKEIERWLNDINSLNLLKYHHKSFWIKKIIMLKIFFDVNKIDDTLIKSFETLSLNNNIAELMNKLNIQ